MTMTILTISRIGFTRASTLVCDDFRVHAEIIIQTNVRTKVHGGAQPTGLCWLFGSAGLRNLESRAA